MKQLFFHAVMAWVAAIALITSGTAQDIRSQRTTSKGTTYMYVNDDSTTNPLQTTIVYKDGPLYTIVMEGDKVLSMTVNGRQVPSDSLHHYDALIRELSEQIRRDREQAKQDMKQSLRDQEQAMRDKFQAERDQLQAMQDKRQAELEQAKMLQDKLQAERDRMQALRDKAEAERDLQQAKRDKEQAEWDRRAAEEDKAAMEGLVREAIKDGLIADKEAVRSVFLDEDNFILNGKVQSGQLHKKYAELFIKRGGQISFRRNR